MNCFQVRHVATRRDDCAHLYMYVLIEIMIVHVSVICELFSIEIGTRRDDSVIEIGPHKDVCEHFIHL